MKLVVIKLTHISIFDPSATHCVKDLDATGVSIVFRGSKSECERHKRAKESLPDAK